MKSRQKRETSMLSGSIVSHGPDICSVRIKNYSKQVKTLSLSLVGDRNVFEIPKQHWQVKIEPGAQFVVPVRFVERKPFRIMGIRAQYQVYLKWQDAQETGLFTSAPITVFAPLYAATGVTRCLHTPGNASRGLMRQHHSPPSISRTVYRAGTYYHANMGEIDHEYHVNIEREGDWLEIDNIYPLADVGETVSYGYLHSLEHCHYSRTYTIRETWWNRIYAGNADGVNSDAEQFYAKRMVGHHDACIPEDPEVPSSETRAIRDFLVDIEDWILDDNLVDFGRYVEYWNTNVREDDDASYCNEQSFDEGGCWFNRGGSIPDMDYMTSRVGSGGLADDMLSALENLIIYTKTSHLPRTFRHDEFFDRENSRLCEETSGITYGAITRTPGSFAEWIAICRDAGADDGTIIHEMFHYTAREHFESEDRAFLVSYLYFASRYGWKPMDDWPDWE